MATGMINSLAWCYFGAGDNEKAIETEEAALELLRANDRGRTEFEKALKVFQG